MEAILTLEKAVSDHDENIQSLEFVMIPYTFVLLVTLLTHFPILLHHSYQNRLLVIAYDKHAYSSTFCTLFSAYLTHPRITYKIPVSPLYIT